VSEQLITQGDVLYEDNHLIAIAKKSGVLVQGDKTGDQNLTESLTEFLKDKYKKSGNVFTGLIHRIDRPVSGVVIFGKTSKGLVRMNEMFQKREVHKTYLCLVEGKLTELNGQLTSFLKKNESKNKSFATDKEKHGYKKSVLNFKVVQVLDRYTLVEVDPETGRHHQIRVQLSNIGHPIKGDLKYGAKRSNSDGSISLHAWKLSFVHPVKKEKIEIQAPLPASDLWTKIDLDAKP